ncbi:hypothetical protein GGR54DRAFT_642056 [Hypoxylon sp. NC1633]|nr:hypothetical protein GGR54DRAFT_642056 [Hypoxylon sp. NC1633]
MADEPVDTTQITILVALSTVLTCLSAILVVLRIWIRFFALKKSGMDDYMSIGALISIIGYLVAIFLGQSYGMGKPMGTLTLDQMKTLLQITLAIEIIYYIVILCVKTSIVFMYDRLAVSTTFKRLILSTNTLLLVFFIVCIGVTVGQCKPLEKAWDVTRLVQGTCIDTTAFFYFTSIFSIILDIWIIVLPIPTLRQLQISSRSRLVLYGVFGIGGLATAFSCARLYSIHTYTMATDPFRDSILVNVWSMVEINVALWCACAPALKPVFSPRRFLDTKSTSRNYHSLKPEGSKKGIDGSTSQSHIIPAGSGSNSSPRISSQLTSEDIELERPRRVHV